MSTRSESRLFNKAIKNSQKIINHHLKVIQGVDFYMEKKAITRVGYLFSIYTELWGDTREKRLAFIKNLYRYYRLKYKAPEGSTIWVADITTGEIIGVFIDEDAYLLPSSAHAQLAPTFIKPALAKSIPDLKHILTRQGTKEKSRAESFTRDLIKLIEHQKMVIA